MRIALAIMLLAKSAAAEGVHVAALTSDSSVTIYRLEPTGLSKVSSHTGGNNGVGWTDARTLWVSKQAVGMKPTVSVDKIVDGKATDRQTVKLDPWQTQVGSTVVAQLKMTKRNEVWVEMCTRHKGDVTTPCLEGKWTRVDDGKQTVSTKEPAGIDHARTEVFGRGLPFPASNQPKGHAVTLQQVVATGVGDQQKQRKVNGAVCKGPSSSATWPEDGLDLDRMMKPSRVTWLRETPAVAMVEGSGPDRLGARRNDAVVFLDCKEIVDGAQWFGAGYWGLRREEVWTIYSGNKAIGSIAGIDLRASPKP